MKTNTIFPLQVNELEIIIKSKFENNSDEDLLFSVYEHKGKKIAVFGISYLMDTNKLESSLLTPLISHSEPWTSIDVLNEIPLGNGSITNSLKEVFNNIIFGEVFIYIEEEKEIVSYSLNEKEKRSLEKPEIESVVIGPQLSFTESLYTNLNVIRQLIPSTDLVMEKIIVGHAIPSEVRLIYMKSVANEADVNTMRQRIQDLDVDEIEDSTSLKIYIEDSSTTIFPQFYVTELPTRLAYTIKEGKIGVLVENSPNCFIGPSNFFSFFESMEDVYLRWIPTSAFRLLRLFATFAALVLTPLYIAVVTFHYELIPTALIVSIGQSRAAVPFPPILEALLIELMIELLREAGARLPTKVGQTMGIVGGIVIGQAAVAAGLTSNILIIVVAMSALASFTTPSYVIGTTFRVLRFPLMILAGFYGIIGVMFGICLLIIHLLRIKSIGRPYLTPIYPLKIKDFNKVFFRTPPARNSKRATMYRPKDRARDSKQDAHKKRDIEE
ncbi:spore germination protein [Sporosarcina sp. Marseille-Q4063]|uniref:spore germination protein n=1 Tax=Sporosarcina sp. Marseille-Q4063 TaxID=2810514 RepID=UPI001BAEEA86|nr:spore germination protein [Sporosarcina sp. Marseille-Q4063]QUW23138.1 spore germination protein [Sporosarcina sp. Marseille-Q4063]